jgi:hypothetical protein
VHFERLREADAPVVPAHEKQRRRPNIRDVLQWRLAREGWGGANQCERDTIARVCEHLLIGTPAQDTI